MLEAAKRVIKNYLQDNNLSVRKFEDKSGTGRVVVHSLLTGASNDLKLSTAVKIAKHIGCSLDELVGMHSNQAFNFLDKPFHGKLLADSVDFVSSYLTQNLLTDKLVQETLPVIDTIYDYCIKNNRTTVDKQFALWFCDNYFRKK